jgi:hypothetical protein
MRFYPTYIFELFIVAAMSVPGLTWLLGKLLDIIDRWLNEHP